MNCDQDSGTSDYHMHGAWKKITATSGNQAAHTDIFIGYVKQRIGYNNCILELFFPARLPEFGPDWQWQMTLSY